MFLIYLCFYEGKEIEDGKENRKVVIEDAPRKIAAYVLFVFLFNTWCGCIMETGWNTSLSNEYVYKKEKVNDHKHINIMTINDYSFQARGNVNKSNPEVRKREKLLMNYNELKQMKFEIDEYLYNNPNASPLTKARTEYTKVGNDQPPPPRNMNDTQVDIHLAHDMLNEMSIQQQNPSPFTFPQPGVPLFGQPTAPTMPTGAQPAVSPSAAQPTLEGLIEQLYNLYVLDEETNGRKPVSKDDYMKIHRFT